MSIGVGRTHAQVMGCHGCAGATGLLQRPVGPYALRAVDRTEGEPERVCGDSGAFMWLIMIGYACRR